MRRAEPARRPAVRTAFQRRRRTPFARRSTPDPVAPGRRRPKRRGAGTGVVLRVWVSPGKTPERVHRLADGTVRAYVAVPADRGRANARLIQLLSRMLEVAGDQIQVISGSTSARKLVRIAQCTHSEVARRIPRVRPGRQPARRGPDRRRRPPRRRPV